MKCLRRFSAAAAAVALLCAAGCSNPTGVTLGDAFVKTMRPADGFWSGQTSQSLPVSFTVINNGQRVASGLQFSVGASGPWGDAIPLQTNVPLDIFNKRFSLSSQGINFAGTFVSPTQCSGALSMDSYITYNGSTYHVTISASWTAAHPVAARAQCLPAAVRPGNPVLIQLASKDGRAVMIRPFSRW